MFLPTVQRRIAHISCGPAQETSRWKELFHFLSLSYETSQKCPILFSCVHFHKGNVVPKLLGQILVSLLFFLLSFQEVFLFLKSLSSS